MCHGMARACKQPGYKAMLGPAKGEAEREQLMMTQSLNEPDIFQVHAVKESFEQACHEAKHGEGVASMSQQELT